MLSHILSLSVLVSDCWFFSHQIENVDACLSFLDARGVNVQGLSAEGKENKQYTIQGLIKLLIQWSSGRAEDCSSCCISNVWKIHLVPIPPSVGSFPFLPWLEELVFHSNGIYHIGIMTGSTVSPSLSIWQHRWSLGNQRGLWEDKASRKGFSSKLSSAQRLNYSSTLNWAATGQNER